MQSSSSAVWVLPLFPKDGLNSVRQLSPDSATIVDLGILRPF